MSDSENIARFVDNMARRISAQTSVSKHACCVGPNTQGGLDFRTSDGRSISATIPADDTSWQKGVWCTLEKTSQGYVVAGLSAYDGGPLPESVEG